MAREEAKRMDAEQRAARGGVAEPGHAPQNRVVSCVLESGEDPAAAAEPGKESDTPSRRSPDCPVGFLPGPPAGARATTAAPIPAPCSKTATTRTPEMQLRGESFNAPAGARAPTPAAMPAVPGETPDTATPIRAAATPGAARQDLTAAATPTQAAAMPGAARQDKEAAPEEPEWRRMAGNPLQASSLAPASNPMQASSTTSEQAQAAASCSRPATATQETQTVLTAVYLLPGGEPEKNPYM